MRKWLVRLGASGTLGLESVVRGHHCYKRIWRPLIGEQLALRYEEDNDHDRRAVAVIKDDAVVGHMAHAQEHSCTASFAFFIVMAGRPVCSAVGRLVTGFRYRKRLIAVALDRVRES